jgi:hypothetical protein
MYEYDASIQIEAKISQPHYFHIYSRKKCTKNVVTISIVHETHIYRQEHSLNHQECNLLI